MKSLETKYNGIIYRSRLEARWAVFMDALGVKHDYEPEGYDLGNGILYLTDFWLPDIDCFMEIKPCEPTNEELEKARLLAEYLDKKVLIEIGCPRIPSFGEDFFSAKVFLGIDAADDSYWWCECPKCGTIGVTWSGIASRIKCACKIPEKTYTFDSPRLKRAVEISRCHRFWAPAVAR